MDDVYEFDIPEIKPPELYDAKKEDRRIWAIAENLKSKLPKVYKKNKVELRPYWLAYLKYKGKAEASRKDVRLYWQATAYAMAFGVKILEKANKVERLKCMATGKTLEDLREATKEYYKLLEESKGKDLSYLIVVDLHI